LWIEPFVSSPSCGSYWKMPLLADQNWHWRMPAICKAVVSILGWTSDVVGSITWTSGVASGWVAEIRFWASGIVLLTATREEVWVVVAGLRPEMGFLWTADLASVKFANSRFDIIENKRKTERKRKRNEKKEWEEREWKGRWLQRVKETRSLHFFDQNPFRSLLLSYLEFLLNFRLVIPSILSLLVQGFRHSCWVFIVFLAFLCCYFPPSFLIVLGNEVGLHLPKQSSVQVHIWIQRAIALQLPPSQLPPGGCWFFI
jgi:hypothetical protein